MFTRVVEVSTKPGKSHELANTINEKVLPILRQQAGFIDETVLTSETEPNRVISDRNVLDWLGLGLAHDHSLASKL